MLKIICEFQITQHIHFMYAMPINENRMYIKPITTAYFISYFKFNNYE